MPDPPGGRSSATAADAGASLVRVAAEMVNELRPRRPVRVELDSLLEGDLGLDSLGRVELILRAERELGVSLPDEALASAQTLRDLLRLARGAAGPSGAAPAARREATAQEALAGGPDRAASLVEVLERHAAAHPDRLHVLLCGERGIEEPFSYGELRAAAAAIAAGLARAGLERGQRAALMLPTGRDYLASFFGVLMAGGVPVPIYPPPRPSLLEDHLRRHAGILSNAQAVFLIGPEEAREPVRRLRSSVESLRGALTAAELARGGAPARPPPPPAASDVAFLQYTSGSTGSPKGVILTHANLLANIRAMGRATAISSRDVFVSWLPLYHDMGLIGAWLGSLYYGCPLVLMPPLAFLTRPQRWLWAIHRHRGTISAAPNFAYELCLRALDDRSLEGLDLSSWRLAFDAAEPVSPETVRGFQDKFARFGLRPGALAPTYGLAESSVGLAFPPPGRGPVIDRIRRDLFASAGRAEPAAEDDAAALRVVGCGSALPGHEIRIVDASGEEAGERRQGRLLFRGPSATSGYFRNPEATRRLFAGDWLDSGDLAYRVGSEVFITGRVKEMIIRAGRNVYPYELEAAVGALPGTRKGSVAVFGSRDPRSGTERLVVMAETRAASEAEREDLRRRINALASDLVGMPADDVMLVPAHAIPKTTSGKIRRGACRELYESGGPAPGRGARTWAQIRLELARRLRRLRRRAGAALFAARAWAALAAGALLAWPAAALSPRPRLAWAFSRAAARLILRAAGLPFVAAGLENLPQDRPCVLAANHSSYLDSLLLLAALPRPFRFVAKSELLGSFFARVYLRGIGAAFVERFDPRRGAEDAARLAHVLERGGSLIFYPEGTFLEEPGLLPFRMGAFAAAARAGAPVVPVAIRGARAVLRGEARLPRRGPLSVAFGAPIEPDGRGWSAAVRLRAAARAEILKRCGEPDRGERSFAEIRELLRAG